MNAIEQYARDKGRLHPEICRVLGGFFPSWDINRTKIVIESPFWGTLVGRSTPTAGYAIGDTIHMMEGALNHTGLIRGNIWDLSLPAGISSLAHEIHHVWENTTGKAVPNLLEWIAGRIKSLLYSHMLYDHQYFPMEQRAIAFANDVRAYFTANPEPLKVFETLR